MYAHSPSLSTNLRRVRMGRALSQQDVATRAGLTRVAYHRIEAGSAQPKATTLTALAKVFGIPTAELLAESQPLTGVRFRSVKKIASRDNILASLTRRLDDLLELEQALNDPPIFALADLEAPGSGVQRAQAMAAQVRNRLGLSPNDPIRDICGLVEDSGATVLTLEIRSDAFFGLSVAPNHERGAVVLVNVADHISRERCIFTTAHELGHLVLHRSDYRDDRDDEDDTHEAEANTFASHLLMPAATLEREWAKHAGLGLVERVLEVKRCFGVSYMTVLYRLRQLGHDDIFDRFRTMYRDQHGVTLGIADEPAQLPAKGFRAASHDHLLPVEDFRAAEPEALKQPRTLEYRVHRLVRQAVDAKRISLGRAAEMLGLSLGDMKVLAKRWGP